MTYGLLGTVLCYCVLWVVRVQAGMEGSMLLPVELLGWAGNSTAVPLWQSQVATWVEGQVELWALQRYQKGNQSFLLLAKDQPQGNGAQMGFGDGRPV